MHQQYQNTQSTKQQLTKQSNNMEDTNHERTHTVFPTIFEPTGQIYTDQAGCFPAASSKGNK